MTWQPGTEVIALYNFNLTQDIPFARGETLKIISTESDNLSFQASNASGQVGKLPANYVVKATQESITIKDMGWFHGNISRSLTEKLLRSYDDKTYLIRESDNFPGDYTLCIIFEKKIEHYHIMYKNEKFTIDEETYFDSLLKLVEHYKNDSHGLVCALGSPLPRQIIPTDLSQFFTSSQWNLKKDDVTLVESITKAETGEGFKGLHKGTSVFVKVFKDTQRNFLQEAALMTLFDHRNLLKLIGVVTDTPTYICQEYMKFGNLCDYLTRRGKAEISPSNLLQYSTDVCHGMVYLKEKKIILRDLAVKNVLIHEDGTAKIGDFGLAIMADSVAIKSNLKFPVKWSAPEAINENKFSAKSDVWSFGVMLWEIYSFGRMPYPRILIKDVIKYVINGYRMEPPENCPQSIYDIMKQAWNIEPAERPDIKNILQNLIELKAVIDSGNFPVTDMATSDDDDISRDSSLIEE